MEMGKDHTEEAHLLITDTGNHDVLLGTSWLKAHNPSIDWAKNTIKFDHCPQSCFKHERPNVEDCNVSQLLPTFLLEPEDDNGLLDYIYDDIDTTQSVMHHVKKQYDELFISRTTVSTHLAKAVEKPLLEIPLPFRKYSRVFSNEEAQRLPKHQPWDHKIDLLPGKEMRRTTVYRLMPPELKALDEYLEEGLKRGTLCRLEAPAACSFFFIDKKDGKLRPVQDYRPLNDITVKNTAPIPLIPELVDKLLGARYFTKLDV
jgi:hypothetical protein